MLESHERQVEEAEKLIGLTGHLLSEMMSSEFRARPNLLEDRKRIHETLLSLENWANNQRRRVEWANEDSQVDK